MLRGSLLALTACALGGASTSPAPEAAGACLTVQSKVTFPVVLGRSRLQNQTLDGGAEVVLRVPPGETLWMLPKGVQWHGDPAPGGDGPMNPDATRPDDVAGTHALGSHVAAADSAIPPIGDGDHRDGPALPDPRRPYIPSSPVWMGFVEAAGGGGAGAAVTKKPESGRQESLGGPGETGDAVETDDMVLGIGDSMVAGVRLSGGELAADGPCLRVVLEGPAEASSAGLRGVWHGHGGGCRRVCRWVRVCGGGGGWRHGGGGCRRRWRCRRSCGGGGWR